MEHVAPENKRHFSFIKKTRGQTKAWIKGRRIQKGHSRLREWFIHQRKDFESKTEIREREEETKRKTDQLREKERRYSKNWEMELLKNRNEDVYFNRKKRGMEDLSLIGSRKYKLSFYRNSQLCWRERERANIFGLANCSSFPLR